MTPSLTQGDSRSKPRSHRRFLGEILLADGVITREQLRELLARRKDEKRRRVGRVAVDLGYATEAQLAHAIGDQLRIQTIDPSSVEVLPEVLQRVDKDLAAKYRCLPLSTEGRQLNLVMADPTNLAAIDAIAFHTGLTVKPAVAPSSELIATLRRCYGLDATSGEEAVDDLVNTMFADAIGGGASEIHLDPQGRRSKLRYLVEGALRHILEMPRPAHDRLVSRVKAVCRMDTVQRRKPQAGRGSVRVHGEGYELRVATEPTPHGEKVSIRILEQDRPTLAVLDDLGFEADQLEQFKEVLRRGQGLVLVAGPAGSGKTTTLYAALDYLGSHTNRMATVEQPVEYPLVGITQIHVDPGAGVSFASGLRSILARDSEVVMVGELKDRQTAHLALQAAQAGRLVLSTSDAGDAREALTRLLEMGLPAPLVASSLSAVLAQRLVRRLCSCATVNLDGSASVKGCEVCRSSGYQGHIGVFELMRVSRFMRAAIANGVSAGELAGLAETPTGTMLEDGQRKVVRRITTLEEVRRVVPATDGDLNAPTVPSRPPAGRPSSGRRFTVVPRAAFRIPSSRPPELVEAPKPPMGPEVPPTVVAARPAVGPVTLPDRPRVSVSRPRTEPPSRPVASRNTSLWRLSRNR